jgi:hypothetical protein
MVSYRGLFVILVLSLAFVLVSFFHVLNFDQPLLSFQDRDMHGV